MSIASAIVNLTLTLETRIASMVARGKEQVSLALYAALQQRNDDMLS